MSFFSFLASFFRVISSYGFSELSTKFRFYRFFISFFFLRVRESLRWFGLKILAGAM